jgi:dolichol-phosphate mannosyltransferase
LVLSLGGAQIFSLSILGDYLGKVLEESKGRPRFIRSRVLKGSESFASEAGMERIIRAHREEALRRSLG